MQADTSLKENMASTGDEKKVKKEDNSSLMEQVDRLSKQNEKLIAELIQVKKQLAEQQSLITTTIHGDQEAGQARIMETTDDGDLPTHTAKTLLSKRIGHLLGFEPMTCGIEQDISDWLEKFEDKCDRLALSDTQKFSIVQDLLKDGAKMWFDTHKSIILTWVSFKEKIIAHFELVMNIDSFARYKHLYNRRRNGNESAVDYFYNMIKLCCKADSNMEESTKIKHLIEGLSLREKSYIEVRKPETTERFLQILIECDKVILEESKRKNPLGRQYAQSKPQNPNGHSQINRSTTVSVSNTSKNQDGGQSMDQTNKHACWSCGGMDHYRKDCPKNY